MIYHVFSVRDRAAVCYGRPFFQLSIGGAIRQFQDEVNRDAPENPLFGHAEDFDLFHLGTFEDSDGSFSVHAPRQIAVGKDLKKGPADAGR